MGTSDAPADPPPPEPTEASPPVAARHAIDEGPSAAEASLRRADRHDVDASIEGSAGKVIGLGLLALVMVGWVLVEAATPLIGIAVTLAAFLPLKAAIREYGTIARQRRRLLEDPDGDASG